MDLLAGRSAGRVLGSGEGAALTCCFWGQKRACDRRNEKNMLPCARTEKNCLEKEGEMQVLVYKLPWPPSVNHYWRRVLVSGKPRTLLSKEGREFKQAAVGAVLQQRRGPSAPLSGRLAIAVTLFPPDRRRYDLDNRLKAVLDSLTEARVWEDDRHVKIIHLEEGGIVRGGACRVCIAPAPDQVALLDAYGQGGE